MVRTSYSPSEPEREDPVVPVHQSDLDRLERLERSAKRGSRFGKIAVIGVVILAILIGAGILVNQRRYAAAKRVAEGKQGALAQTTQSNQAALQNLSELYAAHMLVTEQQRKELVGVKGTAQAALSVARKTEQSIEPITEQLERVPGEFTAMKAVTDSLAAYQAALTDTVAQHHQEFTAYRIENNQRVETVVRRTDVFGNQLDGFDQELKAQKGWIRGGFALTVVNTIVNGWQVIDPKSMQKSGQ